MRRNFHVFTILILFKTCPFCHIFGWGELYSNSLGQLWYSIVRALSLILVSVDTTLSMSVQHQQHSSAFLTWCSETPTASVKTYCVKTSESTEQCHRQGKLSYYCKLKSAASAAEQCIPVLMCWLVTKRELPRGLLSWRNCKPEQICSCDIWPTEGIPTQKNTFQQETPRIGGMGFSSYETVGEVGATHYLQGASCHHWWPFILCASDDLTKLVILL